MRTSNRKIAGYLMLGGATALALGDLLGFLARAPKNLETLGIMLFLVLLWGGFVLVKINPPSDEDDSGQP